MKKIGYLSLLLGACSLLGATLLFAANESPQTFEFDFGSLNTTTISGNHQFVKFNQSGNDFVGTFFFDSPQYLSIGETVNLGSYTKTCYTKLRGFYYNNQRGLRLWPLDEYNASDLKMSGSNYASLQFTGGWFYNCSGENPQNVYGQITHTFDGNTGVMIAGTNFASPLLFAPTLTYNSTGKQATGSFFDSQGGRSNFIPKINIYTYTGSWTASTTGVIAGSNLLIDSSIIWIVNSNNYVLLDGVTAITASGQNWSGMFSAPILVTGDNTKERSIRDYANGNDKGSDILTLYKVGDLSGSSLYASGSDFILSLYVASGNSGQELNIIRSWKGTSWETNTPDPRCILNSNKMCTFKTKHLSFFGMLGSDGARTTIGHNITCSDTDGCICFGTNKSNGSTCTAVSSTTTSYGGSVRLLIDNCKYNPRSSNNLSGANNEGKDNSPSYYDRLCAGSKTTKKLDDIIIARGRIANSPYNTELNNAYLYAYSLGITTMDTVQKADINGAVLRKHLAKMISVYAISVVGLEPDLKKKGCDSFTDMAGESPEMKFYTKTACQLGLMGLESNGTTVQKTFRPNEKVNRGQFGTILSRVLYGDEYNGGAPYHSKHLNQLKRIGIIKNIEAIEQERRGRLMLMLFRADLQEIGSYYSDEFNSK